MAARRVGARDADQARCPRSFGMSRRCCVCGPPRPGAGTPLNVIPKSGDRDTQKGEGLREVISQVAPIFCIQVPMLDAIEAIQRLLNIEYRKGLRAVECEGEFMIAF